MLTRYIDAAMRHARYEILEENENFYGAIPQCRGVYACAPTLEECRCELAEVLEEWVLFRIHKHLSLPKIDKIELKVRKEKAA
jgi:predicted RNase H-like HicB family nuclease